MNDKHQDDRSVIGVYHLSKKYGDRMALDDVSLSVANGEFVFLVGPSGAGKSTLMRMIYMDETPTSGQVVVGKYVSTRMKRSQLPHLRRKVGVVFQDFKLLEDRDVFENVAISMRIRGARSFDVKRQVAHLLNQVGLYHKRNESPASLSGGEQQRVAIARAVVGSPAILLADEPTGNLDPEVTEEILRLLFRINSAGTAVLMATHNHEMVRNFGQRIVHLRDGTLHEDERTGLVGNLSDRLDTLQHERERLHRIENELSRARKVAAATTIASPAAVPGTAVATPDAPALSDASDKGGAEE